MSYSVEKLTIAVTAGRNLAIFENKYDCCCWEKWVKNLNSNFLSQYLCSTRTHFKYHKCVNTGWHNVMIQCCQYGSFIDYQKCRWTMGWWMLLTVNFWVQPLWYPAYNDCIIINLFMAYLQSWEKAHTLHACLRNPPR